MSADNWTICPQCRREAIAEKERLVEECAKAYGKVTPEEWTALTTESHKPLPDLDTLREDYEIGVESSGEFFVSYGCSCLNCEFKYSFRQKENVLAARERKEGV